jgi:hypothetical protein
MDGPLTTCGATVKATLHEIEASIAIQNEGVRKISFAGRKSLWTRSQAVAVQLVYRGTRSPSLGIDQCRSLKSLALIRDSVAKRNVNFNGSWCVGAVHVSLLSR